ncbi:hypothetical protein DOTSEDRAFT_136331 [Dothistroma septosporum NZE10]|uniref:Uncharacterized protein n=1 Tax=Dothistroma septosporum (strain NZE10 / CBS 128990) TaxID=675120 RepID=N1PDM5_DOTSN|nr:hypothetical protein DOTSEDRAFT_136331 [Dothistroma septosporum NZE10]
MCTQELIWCSCGHGEFLPIELCTTGQLIGTCWTIVHGDHNIVLQSRCSYCQAGLNRKGMLGSARPTDGIAERVEAGGRIGEGGMNGKEIDEFDGELGKLLEEVETKTKEERSFEKFSFDDVMSTDWEKGFDLSDELWNYDEFSLGNGVVGKGKGRGMI